ncbi:MAG: PKD domain-containing protein [Bacteroidota bacterium]
MTRLSPLPFLTAVGLTGVLLLAGCSPKPVEVLGLTGPDSLLTNEPGTFTAETNEEAKPPIEYSWSFGDGMGGAGNPATHSFDQPGTYTVSVTASNRKGKSNSTDQTTIFVYNPAVPAEVISLAANPMRPDTRTAVRFTSNVAGDDPLSFSWDFGDGGTASTATPTYTFSQPGTYTVALSVANESGSDSRSLSITVVPFEAAYCAEVSEMNAVFFDRNSSALTSEGRAALADNVEILRDCANLNVRAEGYAAPGERNTQQLSEDRARAVQDYYAGNGIAASRIQPVGFGRAEGTTSKKEGTAMFRRVDSTVLR